MVESAGTGPKARGKIVELEGHVTSKVGVKHVGAKWPTCPIGLSVDANELMPTNVADAIGNLRDLFKVLEMQVIVVYGDMSPESQEAVNRLVFAGVLKQILL